VSQNPTIDGQGREHMGTQRISTTTRLSDYPTLVRVPNCVMIGLAVVVGEAIALGAIPSVDRALPGLLTASLMMAGTMVMNDVYDVEVDRVNNPNRPIASGRVGTREALAFASILSVASLIFAAVLGLWTLLTALLALALMAYYNTRGKRTGLLGNMVVGFNVALPFFYGGLAVGSLKPLVLTFSILAFLANLGREVAKGIPDAQGDRLMGARTLAVSLGPRAAGRVSAGFFLTAVALSALPPLTGTVSFLYFPPVVLADAGFVYSSLRLVVDPSPESIRKIKTWVLVWMFLGLVGFLLGGTTL